MTSTYNGVMFSQWQVDDLVELVHYRYPQWDSFDHPPFVADEIAYKQETIEKAQALLSQEEVRQLLASWHYDELLNRLERLGKDNNMLWNRVPRQGDLALLYQPGLDKAEFALQMQKLLYGRQPAAERIEAFGSYTRRNYLPDKWTFSTYFLFLTHPDDELFVKPQVARWFLKFLGRAEAYTARPSAGMYALLREQAHALQDALQMYHPRDMVDIQSFLWICAQESRTRTGNLDLEGQVDLDVPAAAYEPAGTANLLHDRPEEMVDVEAELPVVGDLLEPLFQAFKLLHGAAAIAQLEEQVATLLDLSSATRASLHAPGKSNRTELAYRLGWARTRLKNRGLIESVERGFWQLTEKGEETDFAVDGKLAREIQERHGRSDTQELSTSSALQFQEPAPIYNEPYPLGRLAAATGYPEETVQRWLDAIERKHQAIFYGPPGTGKTFVARHLARRLVSGEEGFVDLVQFHPAYAYEDFIQGIRPLTQADGTLTYQMVPGRFLQFCEAARRRNGTCVLIIDEINRANLARVLGELMYLLEYREESIPLAGGGTLSIPANVRLIGTMNTADRSIALVDHALRRRFAFIALEPNYDLLRRYHTERETTFPVDALIDVLRQLNRQIGDPHYEVGITFFLRPDLRTEIADVWRMEIEPYLEEYFFDRPEQVEAFRWERVASKLQPGSQHAS